MLSKKSTVQFNGTKEQEKELLEVIHELKDEKGSLMPILQRAQDIYGYLPIEVQKIISNETGIPLEKIYGVVTFYSQFNLNPKGRYRISVCLGMKCMAGLPWMISMIFWPNMNNYDARNLIEYIGCGGEFHTGGSRIHRD